MKRALIVLVVLVSACGGNSDTAPSNNSFIEYRVTGSGTNRASVITYAVANNGTAQAANAALPWGTNWYAGPGEFLYLSAQNGNEGGCVTVTIIRRNVVFREVQSCGAFVIATASGTNE